MKNKAEKYSVDDFLENHKTISASTFSEGVVFGNWRILAFIGKGGTSEVYRAERVGDGTVAALKILMRDAAAKHFQLEIELLSKNMSYGFPRFYDCGEAHGHIYCALELLEPGPLPSRDTAVAAYLVSVARAVHRLHLLGYAHRDLKPQNILFRGREPVIIDFGLVERLGVPILKGEGTATYSAPEQFFGGEVSASSDIHALGILADACFHGRPPFSWERIINRATSSIPARRYPNALLFIRAVKGRNRVKIVIILFVVLILLGMLLCFRV